MKEILEARIFDALFQFSKPWLSAALWFCIIAGVILQYIFLVKFEKPYSKFSFGYILVFASILEELLTHAYRGWDLFVVIILYPFILCCLIGSALAILVYYFHKIMSH